MTYPFLDLGFRGHISYLRRRWWTLSGGNERPFNLSSHALRVVESKFSMIFEKLSRHREVW